MAATQEEVADLRESLRVQFETAMAGLAGQNEDLREEVRGLQAEIFTHLNTVQEKMDGDVGALNAELVQLKDNQEQLAPPGGSWFIGTSPSGRPRREDASHSAKGIRWSSRL